MKDGVVSGSGVDSVDRSESLIAFELVLVVVSHIEGRRGRM